MRAFSSLLAFSCSTKAGRVRQYTAANSAQEFDSLMSTVRHRFDASPGRLDAEEARGLAGLDAAPELLLGGEQKVLIERVGVDLDLDPLAPACDDGEDRAPRADHPHVVLELCHVLFNFL